MIRAFSRVEHIRAGNLQVLWDNASNNQQYADPASSSIPTHRPPDRESALSNVSRRSYTPKWKDFMSKRAVNHHLCISCRHHIGVRETAPVRVGGLAPSLPASEFVLLVGSRQHMRRAPLQRNRANLPLIRNDYPRASMLASPEEAAVLLRVRPHIPRWPRHMRSGTLRRASGNASRAWPGRNVLAGRIKSHYLASRCPSKDKWHRLASGVAGLRLR